MVWSGCYNRKISYVLEKFYNLLPPDKVIFSNISGGEVYNCYSDKFKMVVLKGVPRILSPQLLFAMARMGHGDELGTFICIYTKNIRKIEEMFEQFH